MRQSFVCILLVVLAFVLSACGSVPPPSFAPVLQPTPRPPVFPVGRFSSGSASDALLLVIHNDRSFDVYLANDLLDSGTFAPGGTEVTADSQACAAERTGPALYNWVYDAEQGLAFESVAPDACPEREKYLSQVYMPSYLFIFHAPDRGFPRQWIW